MSPEMMSPEVASPEMRSPEPEVKGREFPAFFSVFPAFFKELL
jgi:hypothetical protein